MRRFFVAHAFPGSDLPGDVKAVQKEDLTIMVLEPLEMQLRDKFITRLLDELEGLLLFAISDLIVLIFTAGHKIRAWVGLHTGL